MKNNSYWNAGYKVAEQESAEQKVMLKAIIKEEEERIEIIKTDFNNFISRMKVLIKVRKRILDKKYKELVYGKKT